MNSNTARGKNRCLHKIKLLNLAENDILKHCIVLIRGEIENLSLHCSRDVHVKLELGDFDQKVEIGKDGKFKVLLQIPNKACTLSLAYCNAEHQLRIEYRESKSGYRLQPLYILCSDEETNESQVAENLEKINLNLQLVQSIFADRLIDAGLERRTFTLNDCRIFRSKLNVSSALSSDEHQLWEYFAKELIAEFCGEDESRLKFIGFIACTKYDGLRLVATNDTSYENIKKHLHGHAALGGGGLALFGSIYFYCWPKLFTDVIRRINDDSEVDLNLFPDNSNYRRTLGANFASSLGAVCHELGHVFDLGHDLGIMGNGVDFVNRLLTVNNLTEILPERVFEANKSGNVLNAVENSNEQEKPRFTRIKRNYNNAFLDAYHRQRHTEEFYFTRNCALILYHSRFFTEEHTERETAKISFDLCTGRVACHQDHMLNVIEIRNSISSFVDDFIVVAENIESARNLYYLPDEFWKSRINTHYLFVSLTNGDSSRFELN